MKAIKRTAFVLFMGTAAVGCGSDDSSTATPPSPCESGSKLCPAIGAVPEGCYAEDVDCTTLTACKNAIEGCAVGYIVSCASDTCIKK